MKRFALLFGFLIFCSSNTFSDTNSEIKVLKEQIAALMTKVEALEARQQPVEVQAVNVEQKEQRPTVHSSNDKIKVAVGGVITRAASFLDNGEHSRLVHVGPLTSPSQFRLKGLGKFNEDITLGGQIELGVGSNNTTEVDVSSPNSSDFKVTERRIEIYLKSLKYGKLWLGQGSTASDNTAENDLSGTYVATKAASIEYIAGGAHFIDEKGQGPAFKNVYSGMDGLGRLDRVRYDTPQFYGITLGATHASGDSHDFSAKFSGSVSDTKIKAGIAYSKNHGTIRDRYRQFSGSASILFKNGISIGAAGGNRHFIISNRSDALYWFGKLGYQFKYFDCGLTATSIDFGQAKRISEDENAKGTGRSYGFAIVQTFDPVATDGFFTIRNHELKSIMNRNYNNILAILLGARVKL